MVLASRDGERTVPLAEYFTGYRATVRRPDELIKAIRIPLPLSPLTAFHKIAKRRFDDISSVAVGLALEIEGGVEGGIVRKARIDLVTNSDLSEAALLAEIRSLLVDLLMTAGLRRSSALATLRS